MGLSGHGIPRGNHGSRGLLQGLPEPRRPLRRPHLRGRDLDRDLLPADLPCPHAEVPELSLLRVGRCGPGSRVPAVPAVPARDGAGTGFLAWHLEHREPRAETDRRGRARRERGGRRGLRREAGCRRPSIAPPVQPASRRLADRRGANQACAVRQAPDPRHPAAPIRPGQGFALSAGFGSDAALQRPGPFSSCSAGHPARCGASRVRTIRRARA